MNPRTRAACCQSLLALVCAAGTGTGLAASSVGCLIEPERIADLGTPVTGVIDTIRVDRGDIVSAGQTLAVLRADVERENLQVAETRARLEADVAAAAANLLLAEQKRTRSEALHASEFISKAGLDQAVAEHEVAVQKLAQAKEQVKVWGQELSVARAQVGLRTVRSPFAGVIVERYANPGERIEEKPILKVAMINPLRVELLVPVAHYGSIAPGSEISVIPELPSSSPVVAKVSRIDQVLDPASNTFRVRLTLPNPGNKLPAGLRCAVQLPGSGEGQSVAPKANARSTNDQIANALRPSSPTSRRQQ